MKRRIPAWCLLIAGLISGLLVLAGVSARETRERVTTEQRTTYVYDQESDSFIRVERTYEPPIYQVGPLGVNVGYEPRLDGEEETWPYNVRRFLFTRPLK